MGLLDLPKTLRDSEVELQYVEDLGDGVTIQEMTLRKEEILKLVVSVDNFHLQPFVLVFKT